MNRLKTGRHVARLPLMVLGTVITVSLPVDPAATATTHAAHGCRHHQLGNPYTPEQDYMAWSAWRARGNWAEPSQACHRRAHSYHRHPSHAQ